MRAWWRPILAHNGGADVSLRGNGQDEAQRAAQDGKAARGHDRLDESAVLHILGYRLAQASITLNDGVAHPVKLTLNGGETTSATFTFDKPGIYKFECSSPGHALARENLEELERRQVSRSDEDPVVAEASPH